MQVGGSRKNVNGLLIIKRQTLFDSFLNGLNGLDLLDDRQMANAGGLILAIQDMSHDLVKVPFELDVLSREVYDDLRSVTDDRAIEVSRELAVTAAKTQARPKYGGPASRSSGV